MKVIRPEYTLPKVEEKPTIKENLTVQKEEKNIKDKIQKNITFYENELSDLIAGKMGTNIDYAGGQKYYRGLINGYKDCLEMVEKCEIKPCIIPNNENLIDDNTDSIKYLMQSVIDNGLSKDENKIKVEIYLTKRQFELWNKKGGEKWLKKMLQH